MYIDLGPDTVIRSGDVIGIFDIDNTTISKNTRGFLYSAQKNGAVADISGELPKSFLVTGRQKNVAKNSAGNKVYISQLSVETIKKRVGSVEIIKRDENGKGHPSE